MGMFDEIDVSGDSRFKCKAGHQFKRLQTKDLDCLCNTYELRSDNTLVELEYSENGWVPSRVTFWGNHAVDAYNGCPECEAWTEFYLLFTDGKLTAVSMEPYAERWGFR